MTAQPVTRPERADARRSPRESTETLTAAWSLPLRRRGAVITGEAEVTNYSGEGLALRCLLVRGMRPGARITVSVDGQVADVVIRHAPAGAAGTIGECGVEFARSSAMLRRRLDNHSPLLEHLDVFTTPPGSNGGAHTASELWQRIGQVGGLRERLGRNRLAVAGTASVMVIVPMPLVEHHDLAAHIEAAWAGHQSPRRTFG